MYINFPVLIPMNINSQLYFEVVERKRDNSVLLKPFSLIRKCHIFVIHVK